MLYPCVKCQKQCLSNCIQCKNCKKWTHFSCLAIVSKDVQHMWTRSELNFYCLHCCHDQKKMFDVGLALQRILSFVKSSSLSENSCKSMAFQERLLMGSHGASFLIPSVTLLGSSKKQIDELSCDILQQLNPAVLKSFLPLHVVGDGNCLYRAVSLNLFGSDIYHKELRFLMMLEILDNISFYDVTSHNHIDLIKDFRIITPTFRELCQNGSSMGSFADVMNVYALSSVVKKPIKMFMPSTGPLDNRSSSYSRTVLGRGVSERLHVEVILMWTSATPLKIDCEFRPNHFVVLQKQTTKNDIIRLTEDERGGFNAPSPTSGRGNPIVEPQGETTQLFLFEEPLIPRLISTKSKKITKRKVCETEESTTSRPTTDKAKKLNATAKPSFLNHSDEELSSDSDLDLLNCSEKSDYEPPQQQKHDNISNTKTQNLATTQNSGSLPQRFMDTEDLLEIFQNFKGKPLEFIPNGIKSNKYFVFKNGYKKGRKNNFVDDCGAWIGGNVNHSYFFSEKSGSRVRVEKKNDVFCSYKRDPKGKVVYLPLEKQPDENEVTWLYRYNTTLKAEKKCKRRISFLYNKSTIAIAEYIGYFIDPQLPHGNAIEAKEAHHSFTVAPPYIRTQTSIINAIRSCIKETVNVVVEDLLNDYVIAGFRDRKQIYNMKATEKSKKRASLGPFPKTFPDEIQEVISVLSSGSSFLRKVVQLGKHGCIVILFTDEMISMIRNVGCNTYTPTVIGVDKTYNLSKMFLTVMSFKHHGIWRKSTRSPPILYGPMALHSFSNTEVFAELLSAVKQALQITDPSELCKFNFGSDAEKGIVNALKQSFHGASHFLCCRHLKENVKENLKKKSAFKFKKQEIIEQQIFGSNGLVTLTDVDSFNRAWREFISNLDNCQEFKNYCTATLYPSLLNGVIIPSEKTGIKKWTNNNAESINHAIKKAVDWKKGSLMELVNTLNLLVCDQLKNIERALFGFGDFVLAPQWAHYCVSKNIWEKLTQNQKQTKLKTFLQNGKPSFTKVKCSSDGKLTIRHNNQCGKKPHQRTRAKPNRTRQFKQ